MDLGSVVAELKRLISAEGQALLQDYNLLRPLVEQMVITAATADIDLNEDQMNAARLDLLQQRGFETLAQWPGLLESLGRPEQEVIEQLQRVVQTQLFTRKRFAHKAEARFLERKDQLDRVVYSLLRLKNSFLARELYLQIDSNESNFADLAKHYSEGPERNTNGIVGPVSLTQAHPGLAEKLRLAQPGVLLEPFHLSNFWLVVRLESYNPALFTQEVSDQMCREMLKDWVAEQTIVVIKRLAGQSRDFSVS